jgi:hypothetical protein
MANVERIIRSALIALFALAIFSANADDYSAGWGPEIGMPMPVLDALDHTGASRSLANLAGEEGLLLFVSRSADW